MQSYVKPGDNFPNQDWGWEKEMKPVQEKEAIRLKSCSRGTTLLRDYNEFSRFFFRKKKSISFIHTRGLPCPLRNNSVHTIKSLPHNQNFNFQATHSQISLTHSHAKRQQTLPRAWVFEKAASSALRRVASPLQVIMMTLNRLREQKNQKENKKINKRINKWWRVLNHTSYKWIRDLDMNSKTCFKTSKNLMRFKLEPISLNGVDFNNRFTSFWGFFY